MNHFLKGVCLKRANTAQLKIQGTFSGQQPRRSELVLLELELSQETSQRLVKFCVVYSYTNTRVKEFLTKPRNGAITFDIAIRFVMMHEKL